MHRLPLLMGLVAQAMLLLSFIVVSLPAHAAIDVYEFSSDEKRDQYKYLIRELHCPKCQNQDISDSNAPIAQDMRAAVHRWVEEGASSPDIVQRMVDRFGEFVTYTPKLTSATTLLWFGPLVLFLLGVVIMIFISNKRKASGDVLSDEEREARVQALLNKSGQNAPTSMNQAEENKDK